jgi:hypothetical protein
MASVFRKLLTPENLGKVVKFVSDKKNQDLFQKFFHSVKDIVPKKKKEEPKPEPPPQYQKPKGRPRYDYYDDEAYEEPAPAAEPKRRRRGKKPLWDIPGISPEDKAEIMRIVSETERVRQETDDQIRMLIPNYKQPKKPKPRPLKRERPTVDIDPDMRPPPPKRRPIRAPEPDIPDDDIPPPLPPRNPAQERPLPPPPPDEPIEPPPLPPRPIQYRNIPPPPTMDAPEPPFEVEELSVPIAPAPPPPPRLQFPQKPQRLLEQIREGTPLKHRDYSNPPPRTYQPSGDLARSLMERRIRVAPPSDDEGDYDDDEWGTGKIKRSRRRVRGGAVLGL